MDKALVKEYKKKFYDLKKNQFKYIGCYLLPYGTSKKTVIALKSLERIEHCVMWCAFDGKTTGEYQSDFKNIKDALLFIGASKKIIIPPKDKGIKRRVYHYTARTKKDRERERQADYGFAAKE